MLTYPLWPMVYARLQAKYNIIAEINLHNLANDPGRLYQSLSLAYKDHYDPNDYIYNLDLIKTGLLD